MKGSVGLGKVETKTLKKNAIYKKEHFQKNERKKERQRKAERTEEKSRHYTSKKKSTGLSKLSKPEPTPETNK